MMQPDWIRAVECCYLTAATERKWLQGLTEVLSPLTRGLPSIAYTFELGRSGLAFKAGSMSFDEEAPPYRGIRQAWEAAPVDLQRVWYAAVPPVEMASRRLRRTSPARRRTVLDLFEQRGVDDALGIIALEPDGHGLIVIVPYAEKVRLSPRTIHLLGRVTAHLSTALRLRSREKAGIPAEEGVEAVLDPDGRVHHASGEARDALVRQALTASVRSIEQARGRLRRTSPEQAVELWQGLVDGRWSLVSHCESDGRRLVLARRNEPGAKDPKALARAERDVLALAALGHSNKHIAYALGLAPTTVATHLAAAMAKIGLRSRRDAIAMFGPMARAATSPGTAAPSTD